MLIIVLLIDRNVHYSSPPSIIIDNNQNLQDEKVFNNEDESDPLKNDRAKSDELPPISEDEHTGGSGNETPDSDNSNQTNDFNNDDSNESELENEQYLEYVQELKDPHKNANFALQKQLFSLSHSLKKIEKQMLHNAKDYSKIRNEDNPSLILEQEVENMKKLQNSGSRNPFQGLKMFVARDGLSLGNYIPLFLPSLNHKTNLEGVVSRIVSDKTITQDPSVVDSKKRKKKINFEAYDKYFELDKEADIQCLLMKLREGNASFSPTRFGSPMRYQTRSNPQRKSISLRVSDSSIFEEY